jgi:hypothetical protein
VVDVRHHGRARQNAERGAEQRHVPPPGRRQRGSGAPDRLRLRLIGGQTSLHSREHNVRLEEGTPVDDRHGAIHAKPDACDDGGHVPRVSPGHRVRLEISSSNFPRFDRNLNTGEDQATSSRRQPAAQTILHDSRYPSHISLPIIPR